MQHFQTWGCLLTILYAEATVQVSNYKVTETAKIIITNTSGALILNFSVMLLSPILAVMTTV